MGESLKFLNQNGKKQKKKKKRRKVKKVKGTSGMKYHQADQHMHWGIPARGERMKQAK